MNVTITTGPNKGWINMNKSELYQIKDELHLLCKDVGKYQLDNLGRRDLAIDKKTSSVDLVTEVDKASEKIIISFLRSKYPEHNILAEEGGNVTQGNDFTWIIDPVDGTTNYAHGYPLFAIAIGLKQKDETIMAAYTSPCSTSSSGQSKTKGLTSTESESPSARRRISIARLWQQVSPITRERQNTITWITSHTSH